MGAATWGVQAFADHIMAAARLMIVAALCLAVCEALPLHGSKGQEVSVKSKTLSKDEDLNTISFQESESQKLSLAGMCFLALTGLFFVTVALLFCVREKKAYADAMANRQAEMAGAADLAKQRATDALDSVPGKDAVTGAATAGMDAVSGIASKVPGSGMIKGGATADMGAVTGAFGGVKSIAGAHLDNTVTMFQEMFTMEKLTNIEKTLDLVPTFSILMLFVMFRAREQGILGVDGEVAQTPEGQTYVMTQSFMMLGVFAIYLQAMDFLDITVNSVVMGNLSQNIGTLSMYVAWGGMIYGVIYARDPARPLSLAAQCIMAMVSLVFVLQAVKLFLQYKKTAHEKLMGSGGALEPEPEPDVDPELVDTPDATETFSNYQEAGQLNLAAIQPFDMTKIFNCQVLTNYVPLMSLLFFCAHMRAIEVGKGKMIQELAETEDGWKLVVMSMYGATAGLFLQVVAVLCILDCGKKLGEMVKFLGFFALYVGLGGVTLTLVEILREKIADGTTSTTVSIAIALALLGLVAFSKAVTTLATMCLGKDSISEDKSPITAKILADIMDKEKMMLMVSMMLMWMHYRIMKVDTGEFFCTVDNVAKIDDPAYGNAKVMLVGEACLVLGFGLVFVFSLLEAACKWLAETWFFAGLKFLQMGFVYFGFGVVVYVAMTLNVPLAATSMDAAPQC